MKNEIAIIEKCRAFAHSCAAKNKDAHWRCTFETLLERNVLLTFTVGNLDNDDTPLTYGYQIGIILEGNNFGFDNEVGFVDAAKNIDIMFNRMYEWINHFELQLFLNKSNEQTTANTTH